MHRALLLALVGAAFGAAATWLLTNGPPLPGGLETAAAAERLHCQAMESARMAQDPAWLRAPDREFRAEAKRRRDACDLRNR